MSGSRTDSGDVLLRRMAARRRRENVAVVVLAALAVLGGGHAILDGFSSAPPGPSDSSTISLIGRAQLAESFARDFVATYLSAPSGKRDQIVDFVGDLQQVSLPATGRQVTDPEVVFVARTQSEEDLDIWSVTVSVRIAVRTGTSADTPRQYYRVAVSVTDGRVRALSVPALVEPPGRGRELTLAYATQCGADTPLAQVASGFLRALLTGSGDIARYTTPDSGVTALRPAPFTGVDTASVTSDDGDCGVSATHARVLVAVNPKADGGAGTPTLAYPLNMVRVAGQWEVLGVDSVPALRDPLTLAGQGPLSSADPTTSAGRTSTSYAVIPSATEH